MSLQITITRAEGPSALCGKSVTIDSFEKADAQLRSWSSTVRKGGGYDKCDFKVVDTSIDLEYRGRYDLRHWEEEVPNLKDHIVSFLKFQYLGERPHHMSKEQYDRYIASCNHTPEIVEQTRQVVAHLENLGRTNDAARISAQSGQLDLDGMKRPRPRM